MTFIEELLSGSISIEGYGQFLRLIKNMIFHRRWPTGILEENIAGESWCEDTYTAFAHQFLVNIIEKNKMACLKHLPSDARYAYFSMFLAQYVADQIKKYQRKSGFSYAQIKRSALNIFQKYPKKFLHQTIGTKKLWSLCINSQMGTKLAETELLELIRHLPPSYVKSDESRIHVRVKERLTDILEIAGTAVEEELLIGLLYENICPKTYVYSSCFETVPDESQPIRDIQDNHQEKMLLILSELDKTDRRILREYFFKTPNESLKEASARLSIPKSTLHYKLDAIKSLIFRTFTPISEQDGLLFLEKFQSALDDSA